MPDAEVCIGKIPAVSAMLWEAVRQEQSTDGGPGTGGHQGGKPQGLGKGKTGKGPALQGILSSPSTWLVTWFGPSPDLSSPGMLLIMRSRPP